MSHLNGTNASGKSAGSLRDCQVASLTAMLNLNPSASPSPHAAPAPASANPNAPLWKLLILDARSQEVLATTLRIQDLRDQGVTLHLCVPKRSSVS
jgi:hypothetical protein